MEQDQIGQNRDGDRHPKPAKKWNDHDCMTGWSAVRGPIFARRGEYQPSRGWSAMSGDLAPRKRKKKR